MLNRFALASGILMLLHACSGEPAPQAQQAPQVAQPPPPAAQVTDGILAIELATNMLDTLGGRAALESVEVLVQKGSGFRQHLGQIPATGAPEPRGELRDLTETIDLRNGRAAFDNIVAMPDGFEQHRTEAYTLYQGQPLGWGTTEGRPNIVTSVNGLFSWATHNTPEFLLRRNPVTIALAAGNVAFDVVAEERSLDGANHWYFETPLGDETIGVYIDRQSAELRAYAALDTETMWGDTNSVYLLDDWRPTGAVLLPYSLEIRKDDGVYAALQYDEITVNDSAALAIFAIPADVTAQADEVIAAGGEAWVPLQWNTVADNITHVVAFSHHSMVVEFPSFVVVVEAPYTEAQSLTLARLVRANIDKPIRYVVPTHPHYDHTGGIRGLASTGATVLVAAGHEAELRMIVEAPHSNPPDVLAMELAAGAEAGRLEVFSGITEIAEGDQTLQLYEVLGIPHVSPKVLAYVPATGVLFQSDLFFGGPGMDATALHQAIEALELDVEQIVGGHGGVLPFEALAAVVPAQDEEDPEF